MAVILGENAYIELAAWKSNADLFAWNYSDYNDDDINGAIVRASVLFVEPTYTFMGTKVDSDQPMQLPTDEVSIGDIEFAMTQAVWQELRGELMIDASEISQSGSLTKTRDKLDVLEEEREYKEGSQLTNTKPTAAIDRLMRPFTTTAGMGIGGMVRV